MHVQLYIDYRIKILRFLLVLPYKCTCTCFHSDNHYYLIQHWTRQYGSRCGHCWLVSRKSRSVVSSCEFFLAFPVPWMVSYGQRGWKNWKRFISTACLTNEVKGPTIQYIKILVHVVGLSTLESIDCSWCNQIRSYTSNIMYMYDWKPYVFQVYVCSSSIKHYCRYQSSNISY